MGLSHTVSGDIASFRTPSRVPIESLKFHFLPKQAAGTPSPENPIPIEGWTGLNGRRAGKNLYSSIGLIYGKWILGTGEVQEATRGALTKEIPVSSGEVYSFSFNGSSYLPYSIEVVEYDKDKSYLRRNYSTRTALTEPPTNITFTVGSSTEYIVCGVFSSEDSPITQEKIESYKMQLERGQVSSCEPSSEELIPIIFPSNGKNIVDWVTPDGFSANVDFFNGWNTNWISGPFRVDKSYVGKILTYSADIDNTAASRTSYLHVWTRDKNNNYVRIDIQSEVVDVGESKRVAVSMIVDDKWYDIYFGLSIGRGCVVSHPMVEWGDAATSYEPYTTNNTFYGGYIDPVAGEIVAEYGSYTFTGISEDNLTYTKENTTGGKTRHQFNTTVLDGIAKNTSTRYAYSDIASANLWDSPDITNDNLFYIGTPTRQAALYVLSSECDATVESFNAWLSNHHWTIVYQLANPIHIPIPAEDLKAFLDHNNFWSDTNDITEVTYAVTESKDILATRKLAQSFNDYFQGELVFELNGDDPPVDGAWVDRVNGMDYRLAGGASYDNVNKIYDFSGRGIGVHDVLYRDPFSIGHHFRIEWDIYFRRAGTSNGHFFDLGSLGSADTALGIGLLAKNSSTITFNWKMQGNSSNPFGVSGEVRTNPNTPVEGDTNYTHFVGFHEIIPWNDGYDRLRIMVNGRISRYETQIPKVEYTQWRTANNHFSVGAGVYNWDVDGHPERYDKDYETDVKVRSIKIFKYD